MQTNSRFHKSDKRTIRALIRGVNLEGRNSLGSKPGRILSYRTHAFPSAMMSRSRSPPASDLSHNDSASEGVDDFLVRILRSRIPMTAPFERGISGTRVRCGAGPAK